MLNYLNSVLLKVITQFSIELQKSYRIIFNEQKMQYVINF